MPITNDCGPHCGIRSNAEGTVIMEGHCNGPGCCHKGAWAGPAVTQVNVSPDAGNAAPRGPDGQVLTGTPMATRWYERAGDYRPWYENSPGQPGPGHGQDPAEVADIINATGA